MTWILNRRRIALLGRWLALFLLVAQFGAEIHLYSHPLTDPAERLGAARNCGTCLASSQLQNAVAVAAAGRARSRRRLGRHRSRGVYTRHPHRALPGVPLPRTTRTRLKLTGPGHGAWPAFDFSDEVFHVCLQAHCGAHWLSPAPRSRPWRAPMTMRRRCAPNSIP